MTNDTDQPLVTSKLYGSAYVVHRVVAKPLGHFLGFHLEWSYEGEDEIREARTWANGDDGKVWDYASKLPEVAAVIESTRQWWLDTGGPEQARRDGEQRLRAAAELRSEAENFGRPCHVRFGSLPPGGCSTNHRDNRIESGVSVYAAWHLPDGRYVIDLRGVDVISAMFIMEADVPIYEVTGRVLKRRRGADGEPLITEARARRIHPASMHAVI